MKIIRLTIVIILILITSATFAEEKGNIITDTLFHHVLDGNSLELFPFVPAIKLPFNLTVNYLMLFISATLIIVICVIAVRKPGLKSRGLTVLLEMAILFIRDDIVYPIMGEKRGKKWIPFFFTLFVFIFFVNSLGLIPAFKTATGSLSVTLSLSLMILMLIFVVGFVKLGPLHFFTNMYPSGSPLPIGIFVLLLELIGLFIKSGVLSLRLFANMFAGHLAILSFLMLIFILNPVMLAISIPFSVFIYLLEVLIAFIQAFIFTLLSCIFIDMASNSHG
jgi:F-type H+-transporting ATPase subunit a